MAFPIFPKIFHTCHGQNMFWFPIEGDGWSSNHYGFRYPLLRIPLWIPMGCMTINHFNHVTWPWHRYFSSSLVSLRIRRWLFFRTQPAARGRAQGGDPRRSLERWDPLGDPEPENQAIFHGKINWFSGKVTYGTGKSPSLVGNYHGKSTINCNF